MIPNVYSSLQAASNVALTASNNLTQACSAGQEAMKMIVASPKLPAVANLEEFLNVVRNIEDAHIREVLEHALDFERGHLLFDLALDVGPGSLEWSPQKWLEHLKSIHTDASHPLYDRLHYLQALEDAIHPQGGPNLYATMVLDLWWLKPQALSSQVEAAHKLLRGSYELVSPADALWLQDAIKFYAKSVPVEFSVTRVPPFPNISITVHPDGSFVTRLSGTRLQGKLSVPDSLMQAQRKQLEAARAVAADKARAAIASRQELLQLITEIADPTSSTQICSTGQEVLQTVAAAGDLPEIASFEEFLQVLRDLEDSNIRDLLKRAVQSATDRLLYEVVLAKGSETAVGLSPQEWLEHLQMIYATPSNPFHSRLQQILALKNTMHGSGHAGLFSGVPAQIWSAYPYNLKSHSISNISLLSLYANRLSPPEVQWCKETLKRFVASVPSDFSHSWVLPSPNLELKWGSVCLGPLSAGL